MVIFGKGARRRLVRAVEAALHKSDLDALRAHLAAVHGEDVRLPRELALAAASFLARSAVRYDALPLLYGVLARYPDDADARSLLDVLASASASRHVTADDRARALEGPADQAAAHVAKADEFRDRGMPAEAADHYSFAVALRPDRTGWRVQLANMLKDSGRPAEAEVEYRRALLDAPGDADIYLQLGHALKAAGRKAEALIAYRSALERDPDLGPARLELLGFGDPEDHYREVLEALERHELTAVLRLADAMNAIKRDLDRLLRHVPAVSARSAFPPALHGTYARLVRPPSAPLVADPPRMVALFDADHGDLRAFHAGLSGLVKQTYAPFEVVAFGRDAVRRRAVQQLGAGDPRLRWRERLQCSSAREELDIAAGLDAEILLLPGPSSVLDPCAAGWFAYALAAHRISGAYCDSDRCRLGGRDLERFGPVLRSRLDRDSLAEADTVGDTLAVSRRAFLGAGGHAQGSPAEARRRFALAIAATSPVAHVPLFLVSKLDGEDSAIVAGSLSARSESACRSGNERLLVVIPTRDGGLDVERLVDSLLDRALRPELVDVSVVLNCGRDPASLAAIERLRTKGKAGVLDLDIPFNWSVLNNEAVAALPPHELIVFANDDMEMLTPGWDEEVRRLLARPDAGVVGAKLLYPDGEIQHAGVLCGWGDRVMHEGRGEPADSPGPACRWLVTRAVGAVTGAFLATRRDVFMAIRGFDPHLPVSYNDVDYCLKARALGLQVLWTPHVRLRHDESKTRGMDHQDAERRERSEAELSRLRRRWGAALTTDPSVSPAWATTLRPFCAYQLPDPTEIERYVASSVDVHAWRVVRCDASF